MAAARARSDKTVQWAHPDWPIQVAFNQGSSALVLGRPATCQQVTRTVQEASRLAGIIELLKAHDFRRGAAREISHLDVSLVGNDVYTVGACLGHSTRTTARGVTALYVGGIQKDTWRPRLASSFVDPFEPLPLAAPFKPKRKRPEDTVAWAEEHGLDSSTRSARKKIIVAMDCEAKATWAKQAGGNAPLMESIASMPNLGATVQALTSQTLACRKPLRQWSDGEINQARTTAAAAGLPKSDRKPLRPRLGSCAESPIFVQDDDDEYPIEVRDTLSSAICGRNPNPTINYGKPPHFRTNVPNV